MLYIINNVIDTTTTNFGQREGGTTNRDFTLNSQPKGIFGLFNLHNTNRYEVKIPCTFTMFFSGE